MEAKTVTLLEEKDAKIITINVAKGKRVNVDTVLITYQLSNTETIHKLRCKDVGTVKEIIAKEGATVKHGEALLQIDMCTHPIVMKDMCAECGADLRQLEQVKAPGETSNPKSKKASIAMVHSVPELIVSEEQALELGKADEGRLLTDRKLVLLVDLDQTLIHTTNEDIPPNLKDSKHFQLWHGRSMMWYHTKFRPGIETFLKEISKLFELHICTFGVRMYAHTIAKLMDAEGKYFSHRILSRNECFNPNSKTANLKALFPHGDSMVCIIDDREDVWSYVPNLVLVKPYRFYESTGDINAPPGMDKKDGVIVPKRKSTVVKVLKQKLEEKQARKKSLESANCKGGGECKTGEEKSADTAAIGIENQGEGDTKQEKSVEAVEKTTDSEGKSEQEKENLEDLNDTSIGKLDGNVTKEMGEINCATSETQNGDSPKDTSDDMEIDITAEVKSETDITKETKLSEKIIDQKEDDEKVEEQKEGSEKVKDQKEGNKKVNDEKEGSTNSDDQYEEMLEWEDDDDYLIYLEDILKRIHKAFYELYDQMKSKDSEKTVVPDIKNIIPYVRMKVLKGTSLLFSGVFPTNTPLEKSRAFHTAKALGANVHSEFIPKNGNGDNDYTTHVVAAKLGTQKVKLAQKNKNVHLVTPDWLWTCANRWERVDERLFFLDENTSAKGSDSIETSVYMRDRNKRKREENSDRAEAFPHYDPLTGKRVKKRQKIDRDNSGESTFTREPQPSTSSQDQGHPINERRMSDSINPLLSFSSEAIAEMDKEIGDIMDSEDDDDVEGGENELEEGECVDDEGENSESEVKLRKKVLSNKGDDDSSSDESMSGEYPKGWGKKKKANVNQTDDEESEDNDDEVTDRESRILACKDLEKNVATSDESDDDGSSIGSIDEEMAAAVEKEFLSF